MNTNTFVTAINCMDGRVQEPIITWMKHQYHADYVDMITEPGPIKHLADEQSSTILQSIKKRVEISIQKHGSLVIAVIGHYDCAGNLTDYETQLQQIKISMNTIKNWGGLTHQLLAYGSMKTGPFINSVIKIHDHYE